MATIEEMKNVLKDTLEERGILSELRARLRAEIFNSLNDKPTQKPPLSQENMIINELIKEYLIFNNYTHSLSVFLPETGQPEKSPFDRTYITKKLKIQEDSKSKELPLLYGNFFDLLLIFRTYLWLKASYP
jgi:lisH domain-containing protein FOPNL